MKVIQLKGLDTDLYPLIGPLVMNPKVLKANNNYPFKTTANHQWYIAVNDQEEVMGFLPVENKKSTSVINNYYLKEDDGESGGQRKLQYKIQIQLNEIFFYANRMLYTIP